MIESVKNSSLHYNEMYNIAIEKIKHDNYAIDHLIDSKNDQRLGLTLITKLDSCAIENVEGFIDKIRTENPNQYFYPNTDIHVTILSIISCHVGFDINSLKIQDYINLINASLNEINSFEISFRGITASSEAIMIAGYVNDDSLNKLRDSLRSVFKLSKLTHTIDLRYPITTAHSTIIRFKEKLMKKSSLLKIMDDNKDYDFGTFQINRLELVHNDWYQRHQNVKQLHLFNLKPIQKF